jgi:hypothetical protein
MAVPSEYDYTPPPGVGGKPPGSSIPQTPLEVRWNLPPASATQYDRVTGAPVVSPIYVGTTNKHAYLGSTYSNVGFEDSFVPKEQAWTLWQSLDQSGQKRLSNAMNNLFPNGWDQTYIQKQWSRAVMGSERELVQNGIRVSPLEMLEIMAGGGSPSKRGGSSGSGGGGGGGSAGGSSSSTSTNTTRQVQLTNPDSARQLVNNALDTYLGRRATAEESQAFLKALNQHEQANPSMQTSTTVSAGTSDGKGNSVSQSSSDVMGSGGTSSSQFAEDWARAQEGSAEYQASTTYLDAFMQALQNPMDVVN